MLSPRWWPSDLPTDPQQRVLVARALASKGMALINEGRPQEAINVYDALVARFANAHDLDLRGSVALALNNKAIALDRLGRSDESQGTHLDMVTRFSEEALMVFDETARRFAHAVEPLAREQLVSALFSKTWVLHDLGRLDEALPLLTELITRFEHDANPDIQEMVSIARDARDQISKSEGDEGKFRRW